MVRAIIHQAVALRLHAKRIPLAIQKVVAIHENAILKKNALIFL